MMDMHLYWKNNFVTEVSISGTFIYNGVFAFDQLRTFAFEDEIFDFLYNTAVGIERLAKIAIILTEHDGVEDQYEFEKGLITHSHQKLLQRIEEKHPLGLESDHNRFVQLLGEFYKSMRYSRYNFDEVDSSEKEKNSLREYIADRFGVEFDDEHFIHTINNDQIKRRMGRVIKKIVLPLYDIVYKEAHRLGIYTYEIRFGSKAHKIFMCEQFDFLDEAILRKELLIFLINNGGATGIHKSIRHIEPLKFDLALMSDYLKCLDNPVNMSSCMGELDFLYEDVKNKKRRFMQLDLMGDSEIWNDIDLNLQVNLASEFILFCPVEFISEYRGFTDGVV